MIFQKNILYAKGFILTAICIGNILMSCSEKRHRHKIEFLNHAEAFIKESHIPTLNNPKSYEYVELAIKDTMHTIRFINLALGMTKSVITNTEERFSEAYSKRRMYGSWMYGEEFEKINQILIAQRNIATNLRQKLKDIPENQIEFIRITHSYRASNEYGATILYKVNIYYFPGPNKKFFVAKDKEDSSIIVDLIEDYLGTDTFNKLRL
jgi:hypothetical protein